MASKRRDHRRRPNDTTSNKTYGGSGKEDKSESDESSPVIQTFREFQKELDDRNDKHERLVKLSRDITIESKRVIFLLHRANGLEDKTAVLKEASDKLEELHNLKFLPLAQELQGQDPYQFLRAFTAGLQEYIEAVTFYHYIASQHLIGVEEIKSNITFKVNSDDHDSDPKNSKDLKDSKEPPSSSNDGKAADGNPTPATPTSGETEGGQSSCSSLQVPMPFTEYMLGIADFTGEMMRMAINSVGSGDLDTPKEVAILMREVYNAFVAFSHTPRELRRKTTVLRQSLQKVENACYNLRVRGSEIPTHMLADVFSSMASSAPGEGYGNNEADDVL